MTRHIRFTQPISKKQKKLRKLAPQRKLLKKCYNQISNFECKIQKVIKKTKKYGKNKISTVKFSFPKIKCKFDKKNKNKRYLFIKRKIMKFIQHKIMKENKKNKQINVPEENYQIQIKRKKLPQPCTKPSDQNFYRKYLYDQMQNFLRDKTQPKLPKLVDIGKNQIFNQITILNSKKDKGQINENTMYIFQVMRSIQCRAQIGCSFMRLLKKIKAIIDKQSQNCVLLKQIDQQKIFWKIKNIIFDHCCLQDKLVYLLQIHDQYVITVIQKLDKRFKITKQTTQQFETILQYIQKELIGQGYIYSCLQENINVRKNKNKQNSLTDVVYPTI